MGGKETKFIVSNASEMKVTVEICRPKAPKKVISNLVQIGGTKIKSREKVYDNMKAIIEGGTEYEFILDKSNIGGSVKFTFEDETERFLQHKVKKGMIVSSSRDIVYSDNLDQPWISYSKKEGKDINHQDQWKTWNEYKVEKDQLKQNYNHLRLGVSIDRKKRHEEADKAYSSNKNVLKDNTRNQLQELKDRYNMPNDEEEDFVLTPRGDKATSNVEKASPNKVKTNIAKGLTLMKGFVEHN